MDYVYHAALWQTFYAVIAGAAATLTGLLFVGMSLNLRTILGTPAHRARARETFGGLLSLLVLSLLVLIPDQSALALGCELAIGALALFEWSLRLQGQTVSRMAPGKLARCEGQLLHHIQTCQKMRTFLAGFEKLLRPIVLGQPRADDPQNTRIIAIGRGQADERAALNVQGVERTIGVERHNMAVQPGAKLQQPRRRGRDQLRLIRRRLRI